MKLSSFTINKILIFSQKKAFLIFPEMEPCTFQPKLKKLKKIHHKKISYTSGKGNPEKTYISGNGTFLYFGKWNF